MTPAHRAALAACCLLPAAVVQASERCAATSGEARVPLVELYTSEGCSSCPPADRWLSARAQDGRANLLAFHVDYWNDLGWPDRFATPAWSQRQRARVAAAGGRAVYTPQVMVGAQVNADWRVRRRFDAALVDAGRAPAGAALDLRLARQGPRWAARLGAASTAAANPGAQVWLAQYVDGQRTDVRAGENRGSALRHDRVVTRLWGPWRLGARPVSQSVVVDGSRGPWGLIAFVQDARGETLQSLGLPACAGAG